MTRPKRGVTISPADDVPSDATVRHVDELEADIVEYLPELLSDEFESERRVHGEPVVDRLLNCDCDVVKFTRYLRIDRH